MKRPSPAHHPNLRIERWHRHTVYGVLILLFVSGAAWLVAHYGLRRAGEFGPTVHPLEGASIKVHGLAAMLGLFFIGSLLNGHIRRALKHGRNRVTGWGMISMMSWLGISGYSLYYLVSEDNRTLLSWLHSAPGLALPLLVIWHIWRGRRP